VLLLSIKKVQFDRLRIAYTEASPTIARNIEMSAVMRDFTTYAFIYMARSGAGMSVYPIFKQGDHLQVVSYAVYQSGRYKGNVHIIVNVPGHLFDFTEVGHELDLDDLVDLVSLLKDYGVESNSCGPEDAPCEATYMLPDCTYECRIVRAPTKFGIFYNDLLISAIMKVDGSWVRVGGKELPDEHLEFITSRIEQLLAN
jgi:hypothetical protein